MFDTASSVGANKPPLLFPSWGCFKRDASLNHLMSEGQPRSQLSLSHSVGDRDFYLCWIQLSSLSSLHRSKGKSISGSSGLPGAAQSSQGPSSASCWVNILRSKHEQLHYSAIHAAQLQELIRSALNPPPENNRTKAPSHASRAQHAHALHPHRH